MKRTLMITLRLLAGLIIIGSIGLAGFLVTRHVMSTATNDVGTKKSKKPPTVRVEEAGCRDIADITHLTGTIEPTKVAVMASPAEGPIVACLVREGDRVKPGQALVMVGRKHAVVANVSAARVDLNKQKDELERIRQLVKSGAIPGDQLDIAKTAYERAKAALIAAETQVGDYNITSPWNGIVSKVWVAEGNYVAPRAPLVELYSPRSLALRFAVPERYSGAIKKGTAIVASIDAYAGKTFKGEIVRVYPELDRRTRTRTVEATLKATPELIPGMFVRIAAQTKTARAATVVPQSAVLVNTEGQEIIFVFKDGKVEIRQVKTGIEEEGFIQVLTGVVPGEQVVVTGNETLRNGITVRLPKKTPKDGKRQQ